MSGFQLKIIALITMLVDHIGVVFFPNIIALRAIGRLAFPIYCFLLVQGFLHTGNLKKYMMRMGIFALLSEIPFDLARTGYWFDPKAQNVFVTLFLGLCCMTVYQLAEKKQQPVTMIAAIFISCIIAQLVCADYQWFGILFIMIFYIWQTSKPVCFAAVMIVTAVYCISVMAWLQAVSVVALVPIYCYNGKKGTYAFRYVFYFFYPVHLLLLYLIAYFFR